MYCTLKIKTAKQTLDMGNSASKIISDFKAKREAKREAKEEAKDSVKDASPEPKSKFGEEFCSCPPKDCTCAHTRVA